MKKITRKVECFDDLLDVDFPWLAQIMADLLEEGGMDRKTALKKGYKEAEKTFPNYYVNPHPHY